nr:autophagy protein 5 [Cryptococcus depauperatus CBS 7841]
MTSPNPVQSSTQLYRRLIWQSTIPICIKLAPDSPGAGNGYDRYFIQAPRYTYLPLLIPQIKENLVELALDEQQLEGTDVKNWWFEEEVNELTRRTRHHPLDLIDLQSYIARPRSLPSPTSTNEPLHPTQRTLTLLLHLSDPPQDRLLMSNSEETCKTQWLNQVKEADFVRWRNTSRVTSLRKGDLESGWNGLVHHNFDLHSRMTNKILPLPISVPSQTHTQGAPYSRPPSTDPSGPGQNKPLESSYATRSVPIRIHLPNGAPVVQEVVPPMGENGKATTLLSVLQKHLPLLFPLPPSEFHDPYKLAFPIVMGVVIPDESEVGWLGACLGGGDGWVRVGICLRAG